MFVCLLEARPRASDALRRELAAMLRGRLTGVLECDGQYTNDD
jgi:hypothetical protein